jgi:hypothetical protein
LSPEQSHPPITALPLLINHLIIPTSSTVSFNHQKHAFSY